MSSLTLRILRNTSLGSLYKKLLLGEQLPEIEQEALLKIAVILINEGDDDCKDFGYRIVVLYSNHFLDYEPLYDLATSNGYIPVAKSIERRSEDSSAYEDGFFGLLQSSYAENFKFNNGYLTRQQVALNSYFRHAVDQGVAIIAPTSYGKSELFVNFCLEHVNANIAVIVPTKALLAQVKRRVLHAMGDRGQTRKIITHPEMYNIGDVGFIAIVTQERLLRILQDDPDLNFHYVFVDEAHNLLSNDQRNVLLAKVIALLNHRSNTTSLSYFTPFLVNADNLNVRYANREYESFRITEHLKTERFYTVDLRADGERMLKIYDQYIDTFLPITNQPPSNEISFVLEYAGSKNIVYLNSPPRLEKFAKAFAMQREELQNPEISEVCEDISEFLHSDYELLDCLRRGVIYHHGSVPDVVRLFIENLYSEYPEIEFVVSSSTLLEGVNIPAEKLFLIETKKGLGNLSASQFKNLVGRVCRFKEIFDPERGTLKLLEPEIYIVGSHYMRVDANIEKFVQERVKIDKKIKDELENVLLEQTPTTDVNQSDLDKAVEILENLQPGITGREIAYARTEIGRACFNNNVSEFNILEHEGAIEEYLSQFSNPENLIDNSNDLIDVVEDAFISYIPEESSRKLRRLSEENAKAFYRMFLDWRIRNASFREMIGRFLDYWERIDDPLVYVDKWGDTARAGFYRESWVDISEKTPKQRVNLAIVRIKEEQDFLDNQIMKFIEVLNDVGVLEQNFYTKLKYGTTDERKITMMKNGFSAGLVSLILERYQSFLAIDIAANTVRLDGGIEDAMAQNGENRIYTFEASFFTS